MFPWERRYWNRKTEAHVWRMRHFNNCMEARALGKNPNGAGIRLAVYLRQELALARGWKLFLRPVLP